MRTSAFGRYALAICVAVAMLAGCGGGAQSQLAPSGSFQQSTAQSPLELPEGLITAATSGAAQTSVVTATAQTGYVGILGGGPVYKHIPKNIEELKNSGFNELIVWSVEVGSTGDLNLNGEFPLTSDGEYIGNETYPDFPADLKEIKRGTVTRVTLSIGSSNYGDWENIEALIESQGTGPDSILYQDFAALKAALPLDAIDFDEENGYDESSTIKFAVMLGKLGYEVTMDPYTDSGFWTDVVSKINKKRAGTVDAIHLQTYAGGEGNSPCSGSKSKTNWDFGSVPVYPGVSDQPSAPPDLTPAEVKTAMKNWHTQCGITGGWLWIFDQVAGTNLVRKYAHAITRGLGGAAR
jgi:hypothetical protein